MVSPKSRVQSSRDPDAWTRRITRSSSELLGLAKSAGRSADLHGSGQTQILDNLQVLTGGAEYGRPEIQRVLEIA